MQRIGPGRLGWGWFSLDRVSLGVLCGSFLRGEGRERAPGQRARKVHLGGSGGVEIRTGVEVTRQRLGRGGDRIGHCALPFHRRNALQCGFCTPGMLIAAQDLVANEPGASREKIREHLSGNYCRCTGYQAIVDAIEDVLAARRTKT